MISPFVGSFINASANLWPKWSKVLQTRSNCLACQRQLGIQDLIPLVSFLLLGGKCRNCQTRISFTHPLAEFSAMLIALAAVICFNGGLMLVAALFGWALLFGALVDLRTRLLPDEITLGLIATGLVYGFWQHQALGLGLAASGAIIGFGVFFLIAKAYTWLRGREGLGMGDAKLLAAGGAWSGPYFLSWIVLFAAMLAIIGVIIHSHIRGQKLSPTTAVSFGPALAVAIYLVWLWSEISGAGFSRSM